MLLGAITLDLFAVLFGGGIALLPIYARDILHVGPVGPRRAARRARGRRVRRERSSSPGARLRRAAGPDADRASSSSSAR